MIKLDTYQNIFLEMLREHIPKIEKQDIDEDELLKRISNAKNDATHIASEVVKKELLTDIERMCTEEFLNEKERASEIMNNWRDGFVYLQGIIKISEEVAISLVDTLNEENGIGEKERTILVLLLKIHSKSIQMGKEVCLLLKNGYPDGALARWRSLHENTVIFRVLISRFEDVDFTLNLVNRFISYSYIRDYYGSVSKGYINVSKKEKEKLEATKKKLINMYGKDITKPNMWAKPLFREKTKIQFHDLEKLAKIDMLNSFYKQANTHVHTSHEGMYDSLAFPPEINQAYAYTYGGSNYGLALPSSLTALSIMQITVALLLLENSIDREVIASILLDINELTREKFYSIQNKSSKSTG